MTRLPRMCALLLVIAAPVLLAACGDSKKDTATSSTASSTPVAPATTTTAAASADLGPAFPSMDKLPGILKTAPPWSANQAQLQLRLRAIGLDPLTAEGQVVHIHQHLDLFVDGDPVEVPANLGIDAQGAFIAALHTHDATGIMHVESPTASTFSLGQFFAVWGVRLSRSCVGGECAGSGKRLRAWVNGEPVDADPTRIELAEKQEIVLAYGTAAQMPKPVPASYEFPAGL
jgi:hypothetical protein